MDLTGFEGWHKWSQGNMETSPSPLSPQHLNKNIYCDEIKTKTSWRTRGRMIKTIFLFRKVQTHELYFPFSVGWYLGVERSCVHEISLSYTSLKSGLPGRCLRPVSSAKPVSCLVLFCCCCFGILLFLLVGWFVNLIQVRATWEEDPQLGKCFHRTGLWSTFLFNGRCERTQPTGGATPGQVALGCTRKVAKQSVGGKQEAVFLQELCFLPYSRFFLPLNSCPDVPAWKS